MRLSPFSNSTQRWLMGPEFLYRKALGSSDFVFYPAGNITVNIDISYDDIFIKLVKKVRRKLKYIGGRSLRKSSIDRPDDQAAGNNKTVHKKDLG